MYRFLLILFVNFILCLLLAGAQHEQLVHGTLPVEHFLSSKIIKQYYIHTTTLADHKLATSTTVKPLIFINETKRMAHIKVIEDIFGTPSSLQMNKTTTPIEIPQHILDSVFGSKLETPKKETPTTVAGKPPDSQNSTDNNNTSNLDDRFLTVSMLKFFYNDRNNDNQVPENRNVNGQDLISEDRITVVKNDTDSIPKTNNAANLSLVMPSLIIIFEYILLLNVI